MTPGLAAQTRADTARPPGWAALLGRFYANLGLPLPELRDLRGEDMPQPYKRLLVHSSDMTPTLEAFYRQPLRLTVLTREQQDHTYLREVVLKSATDARPVEYGVIRICLNHLPAPAGGCSRNSGRWAIFCNATPFRT